MLTKNELKYIQSLYHKKHRDEERLFIAEGPKLADEVINSQLVVRHVYALKGWLQRNPQLQVPVTEISEMELGRISKLQTPNEVVVIAEQASNTAEPSFENKLSLVLDGINDPGNMGTIIRIADWFGIKQMICSNDCVDTYNPKVIQASMGSVVRVQSYQMNLDQSPIPPEIPVYGAMLKGKDIYSISKVAEGILVIGSESHGIREEMRSLITQPVTIPRLGSAESLNAAVATGIILGCMLLTR